MVIKGKEFGLSGGSVVFFPGVEAEVLSWGPREIVCTVPRSAVSGGVYVVNARGVSNKEEVQIGSEYPGNEMVFVDEVTFMMGSREGKGHTDEYPLHEVTLSPYFIDKYEVTNYEFARFLDDGGCDSKDYWLITDSNALVTEGNCSVCHGVYRHEHVRVRPGKPAPLRHGIRRTPQRSREGVAVGGRERHLTPLGMELGGRAVLAGRPCV